MKKVLLATVLALTALSTVSGAAVADPPVCNEPGYKPQPHPPHLPPCHPSSSGYRGAAPTAFAGDVTLPTFPCTGAGCTANFTASLAGGAAVSAGGGVGVVTGLNATVNYSETCAGGQAVSGTAEGVATLTGTNVVGTALPAAATISWLRVGLVAVVGGDVVAAAVFVPQGGLPTCTGGSVTATVAGAALLVGV